MGAWRQALISSCSAEILKRSGCGRHRWAGPWQRFRHVTLPLLTPVILFNLVMGVISSFHIFTQALVVGGTTGKPLESTLMFMVHIYRTAFRYFAMGQAAALAVVLFLAVLVVTLVILQSAHAWVYYEGSRSSDR